jgi:hypothetical protein
LLRLLLGVCGLLSLLLRQRGLLCLLLRVCGLLSLLLRVCGLLCLLLCQCGLLSLRGALSLLLCQCGLLRLLLRVRGLLGLLSLRGALSLLLRVRGLLSLLLRVRGLLSLLLRICGLLSLLLRESGLLRERGLLRGVRGLLRLLLRGLLLGREAIRGSAERMRRRRGGRSPSTSEQRGDLRRRLRLGLHGTLVEDPRLQDERAAQHLVHGADLTGGDLVPVDEDAAGPAARVLDRGAAVLEVQQRMARRNGRVVQPQVRRRVGSERVGAGDEDLRAHEEAVAEDDDLQDAGLAAQR